MRPSVAFVTGASRGLGREIALAFAEARADDPGGRRPRSGLSAQDGGETGQSQSTPVTA